jgi:hypothetical protein
MSEPLTRALIKEAGIREGQAAPNTSGAACRRENRSQTF